MIGIEFVADRSTRRAFPRAARIAESVLGAARERGVLVYLGTGNADGVDGDSILLGPPFVITDEEMQRVAEVLAEAVDVATTSVTATVD
jgi:adenosylmethionine-8-amino-7-oxononanoate aminotransferase